MTIGRTGHIEDYKKELAKGVHRLACLGVQIEDFDKDDAIVKNGVESSLVMEVKEKQD